MSGKRRFGKISTVEATMLSAKNIIIILMILFSLVVCYIGWVGIARVTIQSDHEIPSPLSQEMVLLNATFLSRFYEQGSGGINKYLQEDMLGDPATASTITKMREFCDGSYSTIYEVQNYHVLIRRIGTPLLNLTCGEKERFMLSLTATSNEMYVSLLGVTIKNREYLIGLVYQKEEDTWKVRNFNIGPWRTLGKGYYDWLRDAKEYAMRSEDVAAILRIQIAEPMIQVLPWMRYQIDKADLDVLIASKHRAINKYPLPIQYVIGGHRISIMSVEPMILPKGDEFAPSVNCLFPDGIENREQIRLQVIELARRLQVYMPDLAAGVKQIVFRFFDGKSSVSENQPVTCAFHYWLKTGSVEELSMSEL